MDNISDAKFKEVNSDNDVSTAVDQEPQLLATQDDLKYLRHPLAKQNAEYAIAISKEIDLDRELGLKGQTELDQNTFLKKDIDELTRSNDYYQITKKHLNKLFKMSQLRMLCFLPNIIESFVQALIGVRVPLILFMTGIFLSFGCIHLACWAFHLQGGYEAKAIILMVVVGSGALAAFIMCISSFFEGGFKNRDVDFRFCFMKVKLNLEPILETKIKIPYGAKLKFKEAKDSNLFEGFSVASPEFYTTDKNYHPCLKLPKPLSDPAVLGITKDNRLFMVCFWDVEHDVDRVKTDIKKFKKFKIS
jgi:hypothetical protein